jgi:hypothetical protein
VKAGSGAERVVAVPVAVLVELVELVCVGVVWVLAVVLCVAVELVGVSGALDTVTVFVPPPHAASSSAAPASSAATLARSAFDLVLEPVPCILRMVFATRLGPPRLVGRFAGDNTAASRKLRHRRIIAAARPPLIIIISDC